MGCFLACFGFKEKKKRRRSAKRSPSGEQDHPSYVPLDSDVSNKLDVKENITSDSSQHKQKPKEPIIQKIKKKVSFNLNVKAYEPIPNDEDDDDDDMCAYLSEGEEETNWEFNKETKSMASLHYEEDEAIASTLLSYPTNYRYQNCRDSYDEEDHLDHNELDFDEIEDTDDDDDDDNDHDHNGDDNEGGGGVVNSQISETESTRVEHFVEPKWNVRDRREYVSSVLNPVENLSQWKVVKAKGAVPQFKCRQKENNVAVDASLSNWMEP